MIKSLIRKRSFWLFAIVLITAIVLISQFSGGVLYNVKYECTQKYTLTNIIVFHDNGVVEIYKHNDPVNKRTFANYAIHDDYVYIYEYGDTTYSSKIHIKNKFSLSQESSNGDITIKATNATITFGIIMFVNLICLTCGVVVAVKDYKTNKLNKIKASD